MVQAHELLIKCLLGCASTHVCLLLACFIANSLSVSSLLDTYLSVTRNKTRIRKTRTLYYRMSY